MNSPPVAARLYALQCDAWPSWFHNRVGRKLDSRRLPPNLQARFSAKFREVRLAFFHKGSKGFFRLWRIQTHVDLRHLLNHRAVHIDLARSLQEQLAGAQR